MRKIKNTSLLLLTALLLLSVGTVTAQETDLPACEGENVAGTVVSVDSATGLVTIDTGEGTLCTVALAGDYEHPIVSLFNIYFGSVSVGNLSAALDGLQGWAVYNAGSDSWTWASEGDDGAEAVTLTGVVDNGDGTFTLDFTTGDDGTGSASTEDSDLTTEVTDFLAALNASWSLQTNDEGEVFVPGVGNAVEEYHEEGFGFGQLVKLYAIVAESQEACQAETTEETTGDEGPCGVTLDELFEFLESGGGMGAVFEEFGRPSMLGVGHVRQALNSESGEGSPGADSSGGENTDKGLKGICNARSHSGNANAQGQPDIFCE